MSDNLQATANYIICSLPQRFKQAQAGTPKIHLIAGEDNMRELQAQIKAGGQIQIETETDTSVSNMNREALVLSIPPQLTDQMVLCAASNNKGYRSFADITPVVEVGDTVYLDHSYLTDENEILPGIYRLPYSSVICVIYDYFPNDHTDFHWPVLNPVGGYVLLSRVWASDVVDYELDDQMQKVRWNEAGTIISEYNVPPLPNEGTVRWIDCPLKGALNELHPGQRVLLAPGHALVEHITGEDYLVIRHDYCVAVKQPNTDAK